METVFRIAALCVLGAAAAQLLKKQAPEMGLLLTAAVSVVVLSALQNPLRELLAFLNQLKGLGDVSEPLLLPLCKTVGISVVVRLGGCICRDAGETALAATLETAGSICSFLVMQPLFRMVLKLLLELME